MDLTGDTLNNGSYVDDSVCNEAVAKIQSFYFTDIDECAGIYKELMKHVLVQAYVIPAVNTGGYNFWCPWVKNSHGETQVGGMRGFPNKYIWLDQDLKKSMK